MLGMFFSGFLFILTHISLDLLSLGSAEAYIGWGGKLNGHLMASCDNWFSSCSQKCWGCFFEIQCRYVSVLHSSCRRCISYDM